MTIPPICADASVLQLIQRPSGESAVSGAVGVMTPHQRALFHGHCHRQKPEVTVSLLERVPVLVSTAGALAPRS